MPSEKTKCPLCGKFMMKISPGETWKRLGYAVGRGSEWDFMCPATYFHFLFYSADCSRFFSCRKSLVAKLKRKGLAAEFISPRRIIAFITEQGRVAEVKFCSMINKRFPEAKVYTGFEYMKDNYPNSLQLLMRGIPDFVVVWRKDELVFFEVKYQYAHVNPKQAETLAVLQMMGFPVRLARYAPSLKAFFLYKINSDDLRRCSFEEAGALMIEPKQEKPTKKES